MTMNNISLKALCHGQVQLTDGFAAQACARNRQYLMSLSNENLLQNHYMEAGLLATVPNDFSDLSEIHLGWEAPTCQVRGHFLGHWLSAAARQWAVTGDKELKAKADVIVSELARCQQANGGEWAGSIPEKYLDFIARGQNVWAPQYTLHKSLLGLIDMATVGKNTQALEILLPWARWFHRWSGQFTREQFDTILDVETGGMLEIWADLYHLTHEPFVLELMERYDRHRLFDPLLEGKDMLTNMHANTTIPEVLGAARAWEVTGELRWRKIVEAYWDCAVTQRGYFCTGGQTNGEIWTPPGEQSARLSEKNQEHCTVYNMMRLAEYLFRWSGDLKYADYWERNWHNGIMAQQNSQTGMVAYFLPLQAGGQKKWGSPTHDFWCCHGTLVQAHTRHTEAIYYESDQGLAVTQYLPSTCSWKWHGIQVKVTLTSLPRTAPGEAIRRPQDDAFQLTITAEEPITCEIALRLPWWLAAEATITVNSEPHEITTLPSTNVVLTRNWHQDTIQLIFPKKLTTWPLPDRPEMMAFMDGPLVLAGICEEERTLYGNPERPETLLTPDHERQWDTWMPASYRTVGQQRNFRLIPLNQVIDEHYSVYFPIRRE